MDGNSPHRALRILLLTWIFSDTFPGGDARLSWHFATAFANCGLEVFVLAPYVALQTLLPKNLRVYKIPFGHLESGFAHEDMFRSFLLGVPFLLLKRIDIVHMLTPGPLPSFFAKWKIRPFVQGLTSNWDYENPRFAEDLVKDRAEKSETIGGRRALTVAQRAFRKFTHLLYKFFGMYRDSYQSGVDLWICQTSGALRTLKKEKPEARAIVIPLGYDDALFRLPSTPVRKDTFTFVAAGGALSRRKGIQYLIPAFKRIHREYPEARLLLVGGGARGAMEEFKTLAGDNEAIQFCGQMLPRDVARLFQESDAFVLASLGEPFGIVLLEAAACGLPLVATNAGGGPPDIVEDGKMGYLVEPASGDALYTAMKKLITNQEKSRQMGLYAAEVVSKKYRWGMLAHRITEEGYLPLLQRTRRE